MTTKDKDKGPVTAQLGDMMKSIVEAQQTWFKTMADWTGKAMEAWKTPGQIDSVRSVTDLWTRSYDDLLGRLRQLSPTGPAGDVFEKMLSSQSAYVRVIKWWADAVVDVKSGTMTDPKALADLWSRSYKEFLVSVVVPPFAEPIKMWLSPGGLPFQFALPAGDYAEAFSSLGKQWLEFATRMAERTGDVLKGELKPEAAREFYESWLRGYEETIGKVFKIPAVGPARQMMDRHMKGVDAFMKYQAALADFYGKMVQPGIEALSDLAGKTQEISQGPLTPEAFEKFYQLLLKTVEQRFSELFKSPPFLAALEHTLHTSLDFHSRMNEIVEEQLKGTPIVTRKEVDEVHKELYELKKEIRSGKKA
ncbi:MAG: poly(R)-hydroxyalkanoic acid synthase subunit PhaE [Myxococcota bacterium]|nr:poly(R)-hydroxyalkanoic acid synthase subunit PhaE [Myxococcota bacterium]